jgi:hypothetical protein
VLPENVRRFIIGVDGSFSLKHQLDRTGVIVKQQADPRILTNLTDLGRTDIGVQEDLSADGIHGSQDNSSLSHTCRCQSGQCGQPPATVTVGHCLFQQAPAVQVNGLKLQILKHDLPPSVLPSHDSSAMGGRCTNENPVFRPVNPPVLTRFCAALAEFTRYFCSAPVLFALPGGHDI